MRGRRWKVVALGDWMIAREEVFLTSVHEEANIHISDERIHRKMLSNRVDRTIRQRDFQLRKICKQVIAPLFFEMLAEHCFAEFIGEMILMCRSRDRSTGLKHNKA